MYFTDLSGTTCALGRNYKHKVWYSATDKVRWENRNHDWSKKWLQQNSRYAVKLITKGGFITASRSQALGLQRQLQIKFNLSMRQTILWSTIYPVLTQAIFKEISWPEYWSVLLNKQSFWCFFFKFWSRLVYVVPACTLRGTFWVPITLKHTIFHRSFLELK